MSSKSKVYESYNKIAAWFDAQRSRDLSMEKSHLEAFLEALRPGSHILDLGCGTGRPLAEFLVQRGFQVTGLDGSHEMIALAKTYVPAARFLVQDMRELSLNETFDAILMWHSSFHLPVEDQKKLFSILAQHLKPRGVLMFTSGPKNGEAWSENGGENLYHASLSTEEYQELLDTHGFKVLSHTLEDPKAGGATVWRAQKIEIKTFNS